MSLIDFLRGGPASVATVSKSDLLNPRLWLTSALAGRRIAGLRTVSEAEALGVAAYFACVRNISEDLAKLPIPLFRRIGEGDRERLDDHPAARLLNVEFNPELDAMTGRELLTSWALRFGKGPAQIERDGGGRAVALYPMPPELVDRIRDRETGRLVVRVRGIGDQPTLGLDPVDVLWIAGPSGLSIAQLAARDLGAELAAQELAGTFMENGTHVGGVLTHPKKLGKEALERLRETWTGTYGGPGRAGKPAILEDGMEWKPTAVPLKDAQFLELRRWGVEVVARWFRMPLHKIGSLDRATFSNIEHQALEYVTDTLHPWARRWEIEAERKLLTEADARTSYLRHTFQALLRGDYKTRAEGYRALISAGVMKPNEARALEEMNRAEDEGADRLWMQGAMRTVEQLAAEPEPAPEPPASPEEPDPEDPEAPDDAEPEGQAPEDPPATPQEEADARALERFGSAVLAMKPALLDLAARVDSRETLAIRRNVKRDELAEWLASWGEKEAGWIESAVAPLLETIHGLASAHGLELGAGFAPAVRTAIGRHVDAVKLAALSSARGLEPEEGPWTSRRAGDQLAPAILGAIERATKGANR